MLADSEALTEADILANAKADALTEADSLADTDELV